MTKRVLILFSAVHLSSCIPRSPQGAAEDDDGSLKLTKGRKGTEVSTYSTGTSVANAPHPHASSWKGKKGPSVFALYQVMQFESCLKEALGDSYSAHQWKFL